MEGYKTVIRVKPKTQEQFLKDLWNKNKHYRDGYFKVIGIYINNCTKILCETKYGKVSLLPMGLLDGNKPMIQSAVNPTEYCINMFKEIWGELYGYDKVKYNGSGKYVQIYCKIHKKHFPQTPNGHLRGNGCYKCGRENFGKTMTLDADVVISRLKEKHKNKYTYVYDSYKNTMTEMEIICPIHGSFWLSPNKHSERGCQECSALRVAQYHKENHHSWTCTNWEAAGLRSKYFDVFQCYIIRIWNEYEEFFKIGRTFQKIKRRLDGITSKKYNIEIIHLFKSKTNARKIYNLEVRLKREHKKHKYLPKKEFGGKHECFYKIDENVLKNLEAMV